MSFSFIFIPFLFNRLFAKLVSPQRIYMLLLLFLFMVRRVLVFGNPYLEDDSLAVDVASQLSLPGVEFKVTSELNDLLEEEYDCILDVAYGVPRVVTIDDPDMLVEHPLMSLHDYDVGFFIKLMRKLGKLEDVSIVAIPAGYDLDLAIVEVSSLLMRKNTSIVDTTGVRM